MTQRIVGRKTLGRVLNDSSFALKAVADRKPHTLPSRWLTPWRQEIFSVGRLLPCDFCILYSLGCAGYSAFTSRRYFTCLRFASAILGL